MTLFPLALSSGCLITSEADVPATAACAPSILPNAVPPADRIVDVVLDPEVPGSTEFTIEIEDCNETQVLELKAPLDFNPDFGGRPDLIVETTVQPENRQQFSFTLPHSMLEMGECHRFEVFVTGEFMFGELQPVIENDVGQETWWIAVRSSAEDPIDVAACN
ncbi:MAG: hypothetical protein AAGF12_10600 [Myxococcota bacterium]